MLVHSILTAYQNKHPVRFVGEAKGPYEWQVFGHDEAGKPVRDYIREWHERYYVPYQSIYENEGRMSEHQLKQLWKMYKEAKFRMEPLNEEGNSWCGVMFQPDEYDKLEQLKENGINQIIDLMGEGKLEKECNKLGLKYFYMKFDTSSLLNNAAFESQIEVERKYFREARYIKGYNEETAQKFVAECVKSWKLNCRSNIEEFIKYIQLMQKGRVFIGCANGRDRTNYALFFDYMFNPKMDHDYFTVNRDLICYAENLYHNLTVFDKLDMGWTESYEKEFLEKLEKMKELSEQ